MTRSAPILTALAAVAALAGCSTAADAPVATPRVDLTDATTYADGDYSATGWYGGLPSSIDVAVTITEDVITSVTVTTNATDPTSLDFQTRFADAVPELITGRRLAEVHLDKVAGSSGTPDGLNDAIDKIRSDARAAGR